MELLGEPYDQIVVHDHPRSVARRHPATACSPAIRNVAALGIQPLGGAILVKQPDGNGEYRDALSAAHA